MEWCCIFVLSATATIGLEVLNLLEDYSIQLMLFMPEQLKSVFEFSPSSENTKIVSYLFLLLFDNISYPLCCLMSCSDVLQGAFV